MGNGKVQIGYATGDQVSHSWFESMRQLIRYDADHGKYLNRGGDPLGIRCPTGQLVKVRNYIVKLFLEDTDAEWLFMVDTDMGFQGDVVERLLAVADPRERPVVGALCFANKQLDMDQWNGVNNEIIPTMYDLGKTGDNQGISFVHHVSYPENELVQVAGTGQACILIHRSVLEKIRKKYGDAWYDQVKTKYGLAGEDLSFCIRVTALGMPVYVHTGIKTNHLKAVHLNEDLFLAQMASRGERQYVPPATEPVAVLVPVTRPHCAKPFMQSLRATTGMAIAYAIAYDEDMDTIKAWDDAGATVIVGGHMTFAEKVNAGYRQTKEPWLFLTGEDVRFHPGWLDYAMFIGKTAAACVVGTNDLGSERVRNGEHAVHMLILRSYIDSYGASWDGPGIVAHEGYRHWYVDDEIVAAAKQRGSFAAATDAVVEHMHPAFGKSAGDSVYRLGQSHAKADKETWQRREKEYADAL